MNLEDLAKKHPGLMDNSFKLATKNPNKKPDEYVEHLQSHEQSQSDSCHDCVDLQLPHPGCNPQTPGSWNILIKKTPLNQTFTFHWHPGFGVDPKFKFSHVYSQMTVYRFRLAEPSQSMKCRALTRENSCFQQPCQLHTCQDVVGRMACLMMMFVSMITIR